MTSQFSNHLVHETSPYLLQHAHNPVEWYPWGEAAFAKARAENKPILLSIGYSACHWCHVMERESFESAEIAALMNDLFVSIKVDREERPDLDEIYMNAVQMLTGRGGWPMTVFLTPEGKPFYGGTYYPPEDRHGMPGFTKILRGVAQAYRERPLDVEKSVQQIIGALQRMSEAKLAQGSLAPETVKEAADQISRAYDSAHGGIGQAPKFPNAGVCELFLRCHYHSKERRFLDMVNHTLRRMAEGGIYDHLGGGFHRYSVDEKWLVPHFEKMLYDNAQLIGVYSSAYRTSRDPAFKTVVEESADYLLREMLSPSGGFYATQDADSEGEEGKYFVWTPAAVEEILGTENGAIFCRVYDVTEAGNFEGKNILHPVLTGAQAGKLFGKSADEISALMAAAKKLLLAARETRPKPFRDDKIITSWNGLALSGLAHAIAILPRPRYAAAARKTIDFFTASMFRDGLLLHTFKDGQAKIPGYLDDYALLGLGLLDCYGAMFHRADRERAEQLAKIMIQEFWDDSNGAFFFTGKSHERLVARSKPIYDGSMPSGNAAAAQLLLRLHYFTGSEEYLSRAETVLRCYSDPMQAQPFGFTHMLCALDLFVNKPKEIVVIGRNDDPATAELIGNIHGLYLPDLSLQLADPDEPLNGVSPLLAGKVQLDNKPTAYVCENFTCSAPVTEWDQLRELLQPI